MTSYEMRISDWSSDVCSSDLCQQVRIPAAAFGDEVAAQVQRDPVLAPVQVVVVLEAGVLVVQLAIDRPVGADELAQAEGDERHAIGGAVTALEVVADAAGQVPAIVELLCVGGLRKGKAREKGDTQHADLHCRLLVYGYKARNRTENLTARYRRHRRPPPRTAARAPQSRSEEHTSELQSLMRNSYAVF